MHLLMNNLTKIIFGKQNNDKETKHRESFIEPMAFTINSHCAKSRLHKYLNRLSLGGFHCYFFFVVFTVLMLHRTSKILNLTSILMMQPFPMNFGWSSSASKMKGKQFVNLLSIISCIVSICPNNTIVFVYNEFLYFMIESEIFFIFVLREAKRREGKGNNDKENESLILWLLRLPCIRTLYLIDNWINDTMNYE